MAGEGRVGLREVAAQAGVSVTTASLVLSGKDDAFPEDTRRRVRAAAEALGYRRNAVARALRRQTSDTIGFVSDVIATTPHAGAMVQGAQDAAWKAGKLLVMVNTGGDRAVEDRAIETLLERQVDGFVYAAMFSQVVTPPPGLAEAPTVLLDARSEDGTYSSVAPDDLNGGVTATTALLEAGHRRIGFVQNSDDIPATRDRLEGYRRALASYGVPFDPALVVARTAEPGGGRDAARRLLALDDRPTALFCFNDRMAADAAWAVREAGLSIPGELSMVGYDDQELVAPLFEPPLTTVRLPHYEMGRWAVEHLLRLIAGEVDAPEHRAMPCPLVERQTVAPPAQPPRTTPS